MARDGAENARATLSPFRPSYLLPTKSTTITSPDVMAFTKSFQEIDGSSSGFGQHGPVHSLPEYWPSVTDSGRYQSTSGSVVIASAWSGRSAMPIEAAPDGLQESQNLTTTCRRRYAGV